MKGFCSRLAHGTRSTACAITLSVAALIGQNNVQAAASNLIDGNSTISIDPFSQAGMSSWTVNAINQVQQEWFWFRVGNTAEAPINTISAPVVTQTLPRQLTVAYDLPGAYGVTISYNLTGSSNPGLTEAITIANHTGTNMSLSFFRYGQVSLGGNTANQSVLFGSDLSGITSVSQSGPNGRSFISAVTVAANRAEAALFNTTLASLNNGTATTLNNNMAIGPANNPTYAFEWDFSITAGNTKQISIITQVPEPSVFALAGLALAGLLHFKRQRPIKA